MTAINNVARSAQPNAAPTHEGADAQCANTAIAGSLPTTVERSALQRMSALLCSGTALFTKQVSIFELFGFAKSPSGEVQDHEESQNRDKEQSARPSVAAILAMPFNLASRFFGSLRTTTSVIHVERPASPEPAVMLLRHAKEVTPPARANSHLLVSELSPPEERRSSPLAVAIERIAEDVRRNRAEHQEQAQEHKEEEQRHKISKGRDAVHHADLMNGIRNPAAEDLIRQMEGPFGISPETAVARMEELNRSEKQ